MSEPRIVIVGFPSAQILDITGPLEVFSTASRFLTIPRYATRLVSADGGPVVSTSGLEFATEPIEQVDGPLDTLVVSGGRDMEQAAADTKLVGNIRRLAGQSRRVTSVCSGAFLLAAAGLLDGRRATVTAALRPWSSATRASARSIPAVTPAEVQTLPSCT